MRENLRMRLFLRSFLIQGAWNYERMQNIGFAYSILPALSTVYKDKAELGDAAKRHMELFNTQPFMASLVLGMAARAEEIIANSRPEERPQLVEFLKTTKNAMASAVAAIGDRLFWGLLRPVSLLLTFVLLGPEMLRYFFTAGQVSSPSVLPAGKMAMLLAALVCGFLLYNIPAVWLRWRGLSHGYFCQGTNSCGVDFVDWNVLIRKTKYAGFAVSAAVLVLVLSFFTRDLVIRGDADYGLHGLVVVGFSVAAAVCAKRCGFTSVNAYLSLTALFAVFFYIF